MPNPRQTGPDPAAENIKAVAALEKAALRERPTTARVSDAVTAIAGSDGSIVVHAVWFGAWFWLNSRFSPWPPFDPFPYNTLTTVLTFEAIFLAVFVLASQNRLTREADKRAHLDLQVNLLAEQEMTVVLRMVKELCDHFNLKGTTESPEFKALIKETNVMDLAQRVQEELHPGAGEPNK